MLIIHLSLPSKYQMEWIGLISGLESICPFELEGGRFGDCPARYAASWPALLVLRGRGSADLPSLSQSNCLLTAPRAAWFHSLVCISLHARASVLPKWKNVSTLTEKCVYPDVMISAHVPKWTRFTWGQRSYE